MGNRRRACCYGRAASDISIPGCTNSFQHGGIDEPFSERIDEAHVQRCNPRALAHVDRKVEAIAVGLLNESADGRSMNGTILYLKQLFVFETIYDAEHSFWRSGLDKRASAIL